MSKYVGGRVCKMMPKKDLWWESQFKMGAKNCERGIQERFVLYPESQSLWLSPNLGS